MRPHSRSAPCAAACAALLLLLSSACQPAAPPTTSTTNTSNNAPAAASSPAAEASKKAPVDLEQLAERLVTQSAGVKEGEVVLIAGRAHDAELMEDIAVHVRKVGGFPMIEYVSDRLSKRLFFDVPEKYDSQRNELGMKLAGIVDVTIDVTNGLTENLLEGADPKRQAERGKAGEPVGREFLKHNVRSVEVGNGFYPTPWRARRFEMTEDELAKTFWEGVNVDYAGLQTRGEQVKAALAAGNELHVTNPNGTDFKVRVGGRPVLVSDGIISPEDLRKGGPAVAVYLPAGEVYTTPVAGTAEGRVVHTRDFFRGKQIDNLTLTFAGGKLTSMEGSGPGYADLRAEYDAVADGRKDLFGFVDLGINPNVKLPAASKVGAWVPAGTITVGLAGNTWAGGDNSAPYGLTVFLPGSTVTLDGKVIIENGQLKI
jgi:leucyl aminopeptidase (aminopeptidase T)